MRRVRRILVAVKDPAAKALPALRKAAQLARSLDAALVLSQAIDAPLYLEGDFARLRSIRDIERRTRESHLARLERLAQRVRRHGVRVSVSAEWDYPAYEAVVRAADRLGADLIVAGQHAGAAAGAARQARRPLPPSAGAGGGRSGSPLREAGAARPRDPRGGRADRRSAPREAARGAWLFTRAAHRLHARHAFRGYRGRHAAPLGAGGAPKLEQLAGRAGIPAARRHLIARHASDAIEQAAAQIRSDIVVMGAVARSGLRRLLIGNTAERVLDHLPCDLLVVKPSGFRRAVSRRRRGARFVSAARVPAFY